jgi:hypothetical protein
VDAATIAGCHAKIERAEASIEELAMEFSTWLNSNPYPSRIDEDRDAGDYRLIFDFSTPLLPRFPVRVGEIAHDLRSALDHLVWREAVELLGREPTEKQAKGITFPICRTRVELAKARVKPLVGPNAWAVIERAQPYDRGKPKRSRALGLLHWINRVDKHRLLHGGTVYPVWFNPLHLIEWNPAARLVQAPQAPGVVGHRAKGETEVARYTFDPAFPDPNVRVRRTPALSVSYGDSPRYLRRVDMTETVAEVRKVIGDFARLMP